MPEKEFSMLINKIYGMKVGGIFDSYIDYIRFPFFRNLEENTQINFDFPLSIFVGPNGSGKSSTLHSLYGCPEGYSVGNFWFSTKIDPIIDNRMSRNCFIYSYYHSEIGKNVEVLKTRIKKEKNPDYWEPSRPLKKYAMEILPEGKRYPTVNKKVIYLDFRSELSAFDKFFYFFEPPKYSKNNTKQDYLRKKSVNLRNVITSQFVQYSGIYPQNYLPIFFNSEEINTISQILQKNYLNALLLNHKFFKEWGSSIIFKTKEFEYSEAFAGSGETAIAILVHQILNAENNTLILLDEPEVSLHPGAQKNLINFLLEQIILKKLQIIISTHSPVILENMPRNSIKVFYQLQSGKFHVANESTSQEAFSHIGQTITNKLIIFVEDKLSKIILERTIEEIDELFKDLFEVIYLPGGETDIKKRIAYFSQYLDKSKYILLDGGVKTEHYDVNKLMVEQRNVDFLQNKIEKQTKLKIKNLNFSFDSNTTDDIKIETYINYLQFYHSHIFYLPLDTPEQLVWDNEFFQNICNTFFINENSKEKINNETNFKFKFSILSDEMADSNSSGDIFFVQKLFLKRWLEKKNSDYDKIVDTIKKIKNTI